MRIKITVRYDLEGDALLPYVAESDLILVEARGVTGNEAFANVKGIVLHCVADFTDPPNEIHFVRAGVVENPTRPDPG